MIVATRTLSPALVPIEIGLATVRMRHGAHGDRGLAPGLLVTDPIDDWLPATEFTTGGKLDWLLAVAEQRWRAAPHVAGSLLWRSYTYWLTLPVVLGWVTARRVLLVDPEDVLVRVDPAPAGPGSPPLLTFGLRRLRLAVAADDPLAGPHPPTLTTGPDGNELRVYQDSAQLLTVLHQSLRAHHLDPLLGQIRQRFRLGERTLLGSLAAAVAYALVRGMDAPLAELDEELHTLATSLGVADLVTLTAGPDGAPEVHRRTCCLAFTLPEPKICGSCCLRNPR